MLRQQGVGALQDVAEAFQQLAFEAAVERQLQFRAQAILFGQAPHQGAQRLRCQWQGVVVERGGGGQHRKALAQQVQRIARTLVLPAHHFGQHQVAVHFVVIHQRQPQQARRAGGCCRWRDVLRRAQLHQAVGQRIEHALAEGAGERMQLATLGQQLGLHLRVAGVVGIVQQRLFGRFHGEDQRGGQHMPAQHQQFTQQLAHAWGKVCGGQARAVRGGKRESGRHREQFRDSRGSTWESTVSAAAGAT